VNRFVLFAALQSVTKRILKNGSTVSGECNSW